MSLLQSYERFLTFIQSESMKERSLSQRRGFFMVLWCLLLPAAAAFLLGMLIRFDLCSVAYRPFMNTFFILFPLIFLIYTALNDFFGARRVRAKRPGLHGTFLQILSQAEWRHSIAERLKGQLKFSTAEWEKVRAQYCVDIEVVHFRVRYLCVLGGMVFFFLTRGFDLLSAEAPTTVLLGTADFEQLLVLVVFVMLVYLSGMQLVFGLKRYLSCVDQLLTESE